MFFDKKIKSELIESSSIQASILESGNIGEINHGIIRINQLSGNNLESTAANIYLRVENKTVEYTRLIGIGSNSKFKVVNNQVIYLGDFKDIAYKVVFSVVENAFFFDILIDNPNKDNKITVFYGMDVAIANKYAVRNNEAYVCQYIDHQAFKTNNGYVIASRQNQGDPSYLEQGSLTKNIAFSTDGYQFFGSSYKMTNIPVCIQTNKLPSEVYQYEFAYVGLQAEVSSKVGQNSFTFYGVFDSKMDNVVDTPQFSEIAEKLHSTLKTTQAVEAKEAVSLKVSFNNIYTSEAFDDKQIETLFKDKQQEEVIDGKLQSFFMNDYSHVVLQSKEYVLERPSGQILISGNHFDFEEVLASTSYVFGQFSSQIVLGNTSFNKLTSNSRNSLNIQRISGQRIFVCINGEYKLLGVPAAFQMGLNYSKWFYLIDKDILEVSTVINDQTSKLTTKVKSSLNKRYDYLVTNYLTMAQNEHENEMHITLLENGLSIMPEDKSMAYSQYPKLYFKMMVDKPCQISDDRVFYTDELSRGETMVTMSLQESEFSIVTVGSTKGTQVDIEADILIDCAKRYEEKFSELLNGFHLEIKGAEKENVEAFNFLAYWYTQNALVHFTSPHGLEQYNGAAWGTRDVCQGPAEYFLATQNFTEVKNIILEVFKHQYIENGNWPQWFMFDKFYRIQQHESHGDIIVWPARLVALYLQSTNDFSILQEKIPYTNIHTSEFTSEQYTLEEHLENEINNIIKSFIHDTSLSCYGGGDWDDTLQPAHKEYAANMVSGWTVALTFETVTLLSEALINYNVNSSKKYSDLAAKIKVDYNKYIISDDIPAGFIHFTDEGIKKIIHPSDKVTNMKYRLLPFNRGIISGLFDIRQKDIALDVISKHLHHPDGVRLMDRTVEYKGGKNTYFTRAETASNFGREIGLQYCHAHIRYCEALAKVGQSKELYQGLLAISPIVIDKIVANALPRQRNAYFSSSDGNFLNRYDAMKNFNKLFDGSVGVKGGWRVYSSGPGIYLNQLISNMLGVRIKGEDFVLDPILPCALDNLEFSYKIFNHKVKIIYKKSDSKKVMIDKEEVNFQLEKQNYREGGFIINKSYLKDNSVIEVLY